jgi:hypothetical protein
MPNHRTRSIFYSGLIILLFLPAIVNAYPGGMGSSDYSSGPTSNRNCTSCHSGTANTGPGSFVLTGVPLTYQTTAVYYLTLNITQSGQSRWGFQLKSSAGQIAVIDATHTSLASNIYLNHTSTGTYAGQTAGQWSFKWTAPTLALSTVKFYASGLAANGTGGTGGDYTYTLASTVVPMTILPTSAPIYLEPSNEIQNRR